MCLSIVSYIVRPLKRGRCWFTFALVLYGLLVPWEGMAAGTWTPLVNTAPVAVGTMLLLSDGTVMAEGAGINNAWYRLTPGTNGSYVAGTWSAIAPMHYTRLYYSSQILTDGRLFIAGGEDGTGPATAEVYDPLTNTWTVISPPSSLLNPSVASPEVGENQGFYDSISEMLPNGNPLVSPVGAQNVGGTLIYNPSSNSWSSGPTFFKTGFPDQAEASWVKLPDNSILTIDPFS